ncbi:MAG: hypothetical protein K8R21_13920, partial [Leptospira sp.]|nr:hypothetical protein [Leptospira sp.]
RSPRVDPNTTDRILTMKSKDSIIVSKFTEIGEDDFGNSILKPVILYIKDILSQPKVTTSVYTISNIINQNDIFKSLGDDRIEQLIKKAPKVNFMFDFFEVYINERMNSRMRLMNSHNKSIFIPNISQPDSVLPGFIPFKDYYEITKSNPVPDKYKSEICIPLKYKNYLLIGYIHAMHNTRLDMNSYNTFKLVAHSINKDLHSAGVFEESTEICQVVEINPTSVKFNHSPSRLASRIFSMGGTIIFDLLNKSGQRKYLRGVVKAIKPTIKDFAIACDIITNTPEETASLEEFLKK